MLPHLAPICQYRQSSTRKKRVNKSRGRAAGRKKEREEERKARARVKETPGGKGRHHGKYVCSSSLERNNIIVLSAHRIRRVGPDDEDGG